MAARGAATGRWIPPECPGRPIATHKHRRTLRSVVQFHGGWSRWRYGRSSPAFAALDAPVVPLSAGTPRWIAPRITPWAHVSRHAAGHRRWTAAVSTILTPRALSRPRAGPSAGRSGCSSALGAGAILIERDGAGAVMDAMAGLRRPKRRPGPFGGGLRRAPSPRPSCRGRCRRRRSRRAGPPGSAPRRGRTSRLRRRRRCG